MIVIRVRRPLQPELPPVEATIQDGVWSCEDEYLRSWLQDDFEYLRRTIMYSPDYEAESAEHAVEFFRGEIVSNDFDYDAEELDKYGRPIVY